MLVAGDQIVELEEKIHDCQGIWMGEQLSKDIDEGQRRLIPGGKPAFEVKAGNKFELRRDEGKVGGETMGNVWEGAGEGHGV